jgi:nucleotide-binding universal stress UspA family protein
MFNLKRILCPTDLSENSRKAVAMSLSLAHKYGCQAFFLYVTEKPSRSAYDTNPNAKAEMESLEEDERAVREDVRNANALMGEAGVPPVPDDKLMYRVASGHIAEEIIRASEDAGVDLIVMGSHGRVTIKEFIIGSSAERVVKRATCNVLVVKPEGFPYLRD